MYSFSGSIRAFRTAPSICHARLPVQRQQYEPLVRYQRAAPRVAKDHLHVDFFRCKQAEIRVRRGPNTSKSCRIERVSSREANQSQVLFAFLNSAGSLPFLEVRSKRGQGGIYDQRVFIELQLVGTFDPIKCLVCCRNRIEQLTGDHWT